MTDETRVLAPDAESILFACIARAIANKENDSLADALAQELEQGGYSIIPTGTLERARRIEEAARGVCDPMVQDGGGERWWAAHDALRAALSDGGES